MLLRGGYVEKEERKVAPRKLHASRKKSECDSVKAQHVPPGAQVQPGRNCGKKTASPLWFKLSGWSFGAAGQQVEGGQRGSTRHLISTSLVLSLPIVPTHSNLITPIVLPGRRQWPPPIPPVHAHKQPVAQSNPRANANVGAWGHSGKVTFFTKANKASSCFIDLSLMSSFHLE